MSRLLDFLKGICIGIANVIPGFSGGTMAVILKVYERVIGGFSELFKHPLKVIKDLWSLIIGLIVGIVISVFAITKLLSLFPIPTALFFVGLIIGSIPNIFITYKQNGKTSFLDIIFFIIAISIIVVLPLLNKTSIKVDSISIYHIVLMFVLGAICAAAMILPGVSGSLVLMSFGYYLFLMDNISILLKSILSLSFDNFLNAFLVVLSFGLGAIVGIVYVSKLLKKLFVKYPKTIYAIILGLLIASPFAIIYTIIQDYNDVIVNNSPLSYIIGVIMMLCGAFLVLLPNIIKKRDEQNEEKN